MAHIPWLTKSIKLLELQYTMTQFLIKLDSRLYYNHACLQNYRNKISRGLLANQNADSDIAPPYLKLLLKERKVAYNLRGTLKLNLPRVTTTTYGLHSFRYAATQVWNMLPDGVRTSQSLIAFKRAIQDITV